MNYRITERRLGNIIAENVKMKRKGRIPLNESIYETMKQDIIDTMGEVLGDNLDKEKYLNMIYAAMMSLPERALQEYISINGYGDIFEDEDNPDKNVYDEDKRTIAQTMINYFAEIDENNDSCKEFLLSLMFAMDTDTLQKFVVSCGYGDWFNNEEEMGDDDIVAESLYYLSKAETDAVFSQVSNAVRLISEAMDRKGIRSNKILNAVARKASHRILKDAERKSR